MIVPSEKNNTIAPYAHARFREAFGAPIVIEGLDDEWTFEPRSKTACVKIVLHDAPLEATLWMQETQKGNSQSVYNAALKIPEDVDGVIATIQQHLLAYAGGA